MWDPAQCDFQQSLAYVLMTSGTGGAVDSVNVDTGLPCTDNPREVWSCYREKASRVPHAADISSPMEPSTAWR